MNEAFSRTKLLLKKDGIEKLENAHVAVFGVGGVGGFAVEALVRAGVGAVDLVDNDTISLSNLNRQIIALRSTIGKEKVDAIKERIADINPDCKVVTFKVFYNRDTANQFDLSQYDYVIDAVDTVTAKLLLAENAKQAGVPLISSMGTGNKLDPTAFEVADLSKTQFCPLARIMRKELKKRDIRHMKVVYSKEDALDPSLDEDYSAALESEKARPGSSRRAVPGSVSFVPSVAGLILAGEVVKDLVKENRPVPH